MPWKEKINPSDEVKKAQCWLIEKIGYEYVSTTVIKIAGVCVLSKSFERNEAKCTKNCVYSYAKRFCIKVQKY